MNKRKNGLICIDWDGTLLDSDYAIQFSIQKTLEAMERPLLSEASLRDLIGASEALIAHTCLLEDYHEQHAHFWHLFDTFYHTKPLTLKAGAVDFLNRHQHFDLVIVSNKHSSALFHEVAHFGLSSHFRHMYAADHYAPKPAPIMILSAIRDHHYTPEHTYMVGDSHADAEAAMAAGVKFFPVHAQHWTSVYGSIGMLHITGKDPDF